MLIRGLSAGVLSRMMTGAGIAFWLAVSNHSRPEREHNSITYVTHSRHLSLDHLHGSGFLIVN